MSPSPRSRTRRFLKPRTASALGVAALAGLMLVVGPGCSRTTEKPGPQPRYRALGEKPDFPAYLQGTLFEAVDVGGTEPLIISGFGLVANLPNTGRDDGIPTAVRQAIASDAVRRGVGSSRTEGPMGQLSVNQFMADPRTSVVRVDGIVPPGARVGDRIDVRVSCLDSNTTVSLARGILYQTSLHVGAVNPQNPGEEVNVAGQARGNLVVNPLFALADPSQVKDDPAARQSLRVAVIPDGAVYQGNRPKNLTDRRFVLRLREPSYRMARAIEARINYFFGAPVAAAQDEGVVYVLKPGDFRGDWEHFIGLTTSLFFSTNKEVAVRAAEQLVEAAMEPGRTPEELRRISYAWEGLGPVAGPSLLPLLSDPNPGVAWAAARAAAFIGEPAGANTLVQIAGDSRNPFNLTALEDLGALKPNQALVGRVRELLTSPSAQIRVAAYQALTDLGDRAVFRERIDERFVLDVTPGSASQAPIIWASRTGMPRIAIIGGRPKLASPTLFSAFGARLTINVSGQDKPVEIYHRPVSGRARRAQALPEVIELIARLGDSGAHDFERLNLTYGDIVAILKQMGDQGQIVTDDGQPVAVVLEDVEIDEVETAPVIPGLESLQAGGLEPGAAAPASAPEPVAPVPTGASAGVSSTDE